MNFSQQPFSTMKKPRSWDKKLSRLIQLNKYYTCIYIICHFVRKVNLYHSLPLAISMLPFHIWIIEWNCWNMKYGSHNGTEYSYQALHWGFSSTCNSGKFWDSFTCLKIFLLAQLLVICQYRPVTTLLNDPNLIYCIHSSRYPCPNRCAPLSLSSFKHTQIGEIDDFCIKNAWIWGQILGPSLCNFSMSCSCSLC